MPCSFLYACKSRSLSINWFPYVCSSNEFKNSSWSGVSNLSFDDFDWGVALNFMEHGLMRDINMLFEIGIGWKEKTSKNPWLMPKIDNIVVLLFLFIVSKMVK